MDTYPLLLTGTGSTVYTVLLIITRYLPDFADYHWITTTVTKYLVGVVTYH